MDITNYNQPDNKVEFKDMDETFFLIGALNAFMIRFQTVGDRFFKEMSWKQCFVLICIRLFEKPPTLKELSILMGSSHQNIKQMLIKLERTGYVEFVNDETDRRKQRILLTEKTEQFNKDYDAASAEFMGRLFGGVDKESLKVTIQTIMKLDEQLRKMEMVK